MVSVFPQAKRVSEALDVFGEMLEDGGQPSAIMVNSVLAACARDPKSFWRHAKAIFEVPVCVCVYHEYNTQQHEIATYISYSWYSAAP